MITTEKITIGRDHHRKCQPPRFSAGRALRRSLRALCPNPSAKPVVGRNRPSAPGVASRASAFHPGVFVGIHTDGTVYIVAHRSEMGNGVRTSLPRIVADELDADWNRVKVSPGRRRCRLWIARH